MEKLLVTQLIKKYSYLMVARILVESARKETKFTAGGR
jgi:hypothetical protein